MARYGGLGSRLGARSLRATLVSMLLMAAVAAATAVPASAASPGELYAFGWNFGGQLGNPTNAGTNTPNPTPALVTLPGATGSVVQVAGGETHSLAVTSAGELFAFGANYVGELGSSAAIGTGNPNPPMEVMLSGASGSAVEAAAGSEFSLVVTSRGLLYSFGWNMDGQLGIQDNFGTGNANPTPKLVTLPGATGGIVHVAAGSSHSLAMTSTGQLYAFGYNGDGELGNDKGTTATPTPVGLPGATGPVVQVAAGESHSLALTSTGQLYSFGSNHFGQLGSAENLGGSNSTPTQVTLPGATGNVVQVSAGEFHSLALTSTGQVYAFGRNDVGELGVPVGTGTSTPTLVSFPGATGPVVQIIAGGTHSLAVTSSGQLYGFGDDQSGELGGSAPSVAIPTLIPIAGGATIDTAGGGSEAFHTLAVVANLSVATAALPRGGVGETYSSGVHAEGGAAPFRWSATGLPGGLTIDAASGAITGTPTASGTYTVTATVTDRDRIMASKQLSLAIDPAASGVAQTAPAVLSALSVAPRTVVLGGRLVNGRCVQRTRANLARPRCARPLSLRIVFRLSAPASVVFTIKRFSAGRVVGARCVAPTRANARRRRCTRLLAVAGSLVRSGAAGTTAFAFTGRIGGRSLAAGAYQLTAAPAGGGAGQTSTFMILP